MFQMLMLIKNRILLDLTSKSNCIVLLPGYSVFILHLILIWVIFWIF